MGSIDKDDEARRDRLKKVFGPIVEDVLENHGILERLEDIETKMSTFFAASSWDIEVIQVKEADGSNSKEFLLRIDGQLYRAERHSWEARKPGVVYRGQTRGEALADIFKERDV